MSQFSNDYATDNNFPEFIVHKPIKYVQRTCTYVYMHIYSYRIYTTCSLHVKCMHVSLVITVICFVLNFFELLLSTGNKILYYKSFNITFLLWVLGDPFHALTFGKYFMHMRVKDLITS